MTHGLGVAGRQVLSRLLAAAQAEGGALDGLWLAPSERALWFVPRAMLRLQRWDALVPTLCSLRFAVEACWEFGLGEVLPRLEIQPPFRDPTRF